MNDLDIAAIGNCSFGALIDRRARIVWTCLPRFDSDPVFCTLLSSAAADSMKVRTERIPTAPIVPAAACPARRTFVAVELPQRVGYTEATDRK